MSDTLALVLTVVLLGANAFFVGAEFALISARRTQIEVRASNGSRTAATTLHAMENVSLMMAGAQLGITICSLGLGALSEPAIAHLLEGPFNTIGIPEGAHHPLSFAIALSLVTFLHVVLGEMVPKNITLAAPDRAALILAPPLVMVVRILRPLITGLNSIANAILRLLRTEPRDEVASVFTRAEVAAMVEEAHTEGFLDASDEKLVLDALTFEDLKARSILLPMDKLRTLPPDVTPEQMEAVVAEANYSRYPIADETGELIGYVHVKDLMQTDPELRVRPLERSRIRVLPTVREADSLQSIITTMQVSGAHLAAVRSADGTPLGVVTLEDTVEELVGRIRG
ncbi:MAG: HlyC/CorC family transporter [Pseudonocardiales bacterium]|nr:HlyC/CorC family transporter [Jatrophihabitantaceae bacterium]MCW2602252.1 HlyC/CorC family transporter [Pseudonocardiales bacterium]